MKISFWLVFIIVGVIALSSLAFAIISAKNLVPTDQKPILPVSIGITCLTGGHSTYAGIILEEIDKNKNPIINTRKAVWSSIGNATFTNLVGGKNFKVAAYRVDESTFKLATGLFISNSNSPLGGVADQLKIDAAKAIMLSSLHGSKTYMRLMSSPQDQINLSH